MIVEAAVDMHYQLKSKDAPRAQLELAYSESGMLQCVAVRCIVL